MYTYNFATNTLATIFDGLETVTLGSNMDISFPGIQKEDLKFVKPFESNGDGGWHVGYPIAKLGKVVIKSIYDSGDRGQIIVQASYGMRKLSFSINGTNLHLTASM